MKDHNETREEALKEISAAIAMPPELPPISWAGIRPWWTGTGDQAQTNEGDRDERFEKNWETENQEPGMQETPGHSPILKDEERRRVSQIPEP